GRRPGRALAHEYEPALVLDDDRDPRDGVPVAYEPAGQALRIFRAVVAQLRPAVRAERAAGVRLRAHGAGSRSSARSRPTSMRSPATLSMAMSTPLFAGCSPVPQWSRAREMTTSGTAATAP